MIEVTKENFDGEVLNEKIPVFVDFWAEWCTPCHMIAPIFEKLSSEYEGKVKFCKVNVDNSPELASRFGILGIPTLILFKDGEEKERLVGVQSEEKLRSVLDKYV
ncbi:MAG: thioredoxin [Caldiserica bacterium]|nr:MAG: thioredoxin [Caldisericota bacterium]